ncbi:MAG TPA: hypothetical protein VNI83_09740, partial [Vicinamibacterales bacterium]|nr:hypothetical protein [Vicinamibacterales bacterium]
TDVTAALAAAAPQAPPTDGRASDGTERGHGAARAGGVAELWVSRMFASPHHEGTAFVAKTGFRADDFRPLLFRTTDFGATWTSIASNLPDRPVNVVWQDRRNPDLLFAGTDGGVFVSIDGGGRWVRMPGVPVVPVHDLLVHPREHDLVVATYGRGLFVTDITPLQELTPAVLQRPAHFFAIEPKRRRGARALGNYHLYGDRFLWTPNEPDALVLVYFVRDGADRAVLRIADPAGREVRVLEGPARPGLNRVLWNFEDAARRPVPAGTYRITLEVAGMTLQREGRILGERETTTPESPADTEHTRNTARDTTDTRSTGPAKRTKSTDDTEGTDGTGATWPRSGRDDTTAETRTGNHTGAGAGVSRRGFAARRERWRGARRAGA